MDRGGAIGISAQSAAVRCLFARRRLGGGLGFGEDREEVGADGDAIGDAGLVQSRREFAGALEEAGVTDFIAIGSNLLSILSEAQAAA